jgi:hypothetical protein
MEGAAIFCVACAAILGDGMMSTLVLVRYRRMRTFFKVKSESFDVGSEDLNPIARSIFHLNQSPISWKIRAQDELVTE